MVGLGHVSTNKSKLLITAGKELTVGHELKNIDAFLKLINISESMTNFLCKQSNFQ